MTSIKIINGPGETGTYIANILTKRILERSNARIISDDTADFTIRLGIKPGVDAEGYTISSASGGAIEITGSDRLGLLYGAGKFLRTSQFDDGNFIPGGWHGSSVPQCPVRGIYMAVHFNNFYEAAPADKTERYIEDLALWGMNSVVFHFPPQQFDGLSDPAAKQNIAKIHLLMQTAKRLGLKVGLIECPNIGYKNSPKEFYFQPFPDDLQRRGNLGVLLCPGKPESRQFLMKQWDEILDALDVDLDFFTFWPYDEGGCGCDKCWPWGSKGFLSISKRVGEMIHSKYPDCKFILSTWMYDTPYAGEWEGLSKALENEHWIDYIMADAHEDFPRYPLDNEVPGKLPLINFPEISMWGQGPWGGYGANPLPDRFQKLWNEASNKLSGGFPYSEGIFEDINKVICLQFYWDKNRSAKDIVGEYVSSEFSPNVMEKVDKAICIIESNHNREQIGESAIQAWELVRDADVTLSAHVKESWRWRILFLRAKIDSELYKNGGKCSGPVLKEAFAELTDIYYAYEAYGVVKPPIVTE